ncbi:serine/arginine repetitive matrix protein 1-like isoform X6 [Cloeon dipterum]
MPPQHPEQHELPGAMMQPEQPHHGSAALQTHSNKFPIEREVIVTGEKSSSTFKARILPEFRGQSGGPTTSRLQPVHSPRGQHRPPPGAIAPDAPTRQLAWTQDSVVKRSSCDAEQLLLSRGATEDEINRQRQLFKAHTMHDVSRGPPQDPYSVYARSPYHPGGGGGENPYMYRQPEMVMPRGHEGRTQPEMVPGVVFSTPTPRPRPPAEQEPPQHRPPPPPTSAAAPETPSKKFPAKTYHTIKDMISTRFGAKEAPGGKEDDGGFGRPAAEGKSDEPIYNHHQGGVYTAHRLKAREAGDGGGRASAGSSDYEKPSSAGGDSGRGPSAKDTSTESSCSPQSRQDIQNGESEWVDMESELRQILDPRTMHLAPPTAAPRMGANSNLSESVGSMTPPLPPLSPSGSPCVTPKASRSYKNQPTQSSVSQSATKSAAKASGSKSIQTPRNAIQTPNGPQRGWNRPKSMQATPVEKSGRSAKKEQASPMKSSSKIVMSPLHTFGPPDSAADMTSTTTGLDLDSVLDGQTENTSDDDDDEEEDDLSTTVDTTDAQAIRRQLEGLENMYSEVLKMLGVKKYTGGGRYPADTRPNRRRLYGSMSSLPSSVSSRPVRERRGRQDERKKVKDIKGINKRFQRLESHVVTLARSVAHLSSEMRTQHLMLQEIENIREEVANLRATQPALRGHSAPRITSLKNYEPSNPLGTNERIKKLTKFFGDEPPLLRLFLRKLGYEKYATNFESEKVGLMELPYVSEERLQKMGIPLGPRLRILQEAQVAANACANQDSTFSVYVV